MLPVKNARDSAMMILATKMGEIKALKEGELTNIRGFRPDCDEPGGGG